jgi:hypothetical protein
MFETRGLFEAAYVVVYREIRSWMPIARASAVVSFAGTRRVRNSTDLSCAGSLRAIVSSRASASTSGPTPSWEGTMLTWPPETTNAASFAGRPTAPILGNTRALTFEESIRASSVMPT